MSHSLTIGQRVVLKMKEFEHNDQVQFTITGFSKYNQFDMNGNEQVHILHVDKNDHFTDLSVHFSLLRPLKHE